MIARLTRTRSAVRRHAPIAWVSALALTTLTLSTAVPATAGPVALDHARPGHRIAEPPRLGHPPHGGHHAGYAPVQALAAASADVVRAGAVGHLAYVDDGRHVTRLANGLADRATGRRLRPDDRFEVGSNTKTFMAVLTLQSVGRRELALDDSVEKLLPGVVPGGEAITLRMLLNHTSGLFNYTEDETLVTDLFDDRTRMMTPAELVAIATSHEPNFAPGTSWSYSNTNYILVGMILERATGRRVADLLQERIARPLGLRHTELVTTTARNTDVGYAHGYIASFATTPTTYTDVSGDAIGGWAGTAGAVVSTAPDLARFFTNVVRGPLLPSHLRAEMQRTVDLSEFIEGDDVGYGLGIMKVTTPCGTVWGHGGDTLGHHSGAVVSLDGRRAAITDTTTQPSDFDGPIDPAVALYDTYSRADYVAICTMYGRTAPED